MFWYTDRCLVLSIQISSIQTLFEWFSDAFCPVFGHHSKTAQSDNWVHFYSLNTRQHIPVFGSPMYFFGSIYNLTRNMNLAFWAEILPFTTLLIFALGKFFIQKVPIKSLVCKVSKLENLTPISHAL